MKIVVRADGDPLSILPDVREVVHGLDPDPPIADVRPMSSILGDSMSRTTFTMLMIVLASAVATFLACVGVYGIIAYTLSQRTSEIGMRLALGADPSHVFGIMFWHGIKLASVGIVLGLAGAIGLSGILSGVRYSC